MSDTPTITPAQWKARARTDEHKLQKECYKWFNLRYPKYRGLLFAVPNGGYRTATTAARLKAEGEVAGVSDLILLHPQPRPPLFIEMKTPKGRQSPHQKAWQEVVESFGYEYVICRTFEDFVNLVSNFFG